MPKQELTFQVSFKVRSYEVDHHQEASISTICNYFQEAAGLHARELKFDISDLQKKGLTWILYKLQVNVKTFPKRWEAIKVITWPSTGEGLRAYRDYELHNEHGELLASGLSQWMVLDIQKKRPVKMPNEFMNSRFKTDKHVLDLHKSNLVDLSQEGSTFITTVGLNDLDMNHHVNNVRYIDWMTGYYYPEKSEPAKCDEIIIQYVSETNAGDEIYLSSQDILNEDKTVSYTLFKNDKKQVIANAQTHWR